MTDAVAKAHQEILRLMRAPDWQAADSACRGLIAQYPRFVAGWLAASQIALALKRPDVALEAIDQAIVLEPTNVNHLIHRAKCLMMLKRRRDALQDITAAERSTPADPAVWDVIGSICSYANDQTRALAAYDQAVALAPRVPHFLYNRASVRRFLGDLEGAEADCDRVIAMRPTDFEAYVNRSDLRVQTYPAQPHQGVGGNSGSGNHGLEGRSTDPLCACQGVRGPGRVLEILRAIVARGNNAPQAPEIRRRHGRGDR